MGNLGPLCDHHHQLKHRRGWTLQRDPNTAEATWTSPTRHVHRVQHDDHRSWSHDLNGNPIHTSEATNGDGWDDVEPPANDQANDGLSNLEAAIEDAVPERQPKVA